MQEFVNLSRVKNQVILITSGGDNRFDICMLGKSIHALFFAHVE